MKLEIITLFPNFFEGIFSQSILKRACESGIFEYRIHDLREFTTDKHHQADDYRFGGGSGMLLKPDPFFRVMEKIMKRAETRPLVIFPSAQGAVFNQEIADSFAREPHLVFLCGHYKGIDQRVIERWVDREYSLGDYVITGGETAATVMIDAAIRMIPGVLGNLDSALTDSFRDGYLDCPHYTRPDEFAGLRVPELLLGGHHKNINIWRQAMSRVITKHRRPDLLNIQDNKEPWKAGKK